MNGPAGRTLEPVLAAVLGMLLGGAVGHGWGLAFGTGLLGGALAVAAVSLLDSRRAARLTLWLQSPMQTAAPRDPGFWGEIGYRMERALRQREQGIAAERERLAQFLSAIEASPNGVLMLDTEDQIAWCNSVAADHFEIDPERDRQQRITNLVRAPAFAAYLAGDDFSEPVTFQGGLIKRSLQVLVRPYGDGLKLVLSQDITERERAEGMRRDFVANVSHEIRTPLTVLAGFVETMQALKLTGVERERVLVLMSQQTDRMQALVADLLALSQLEGSPRPAPDHWVALEPLLRRAEADALALSADRHELSFDRGSDFELAGSETELASAIGNLVGNAIRYTPAGGRIYVRWTTRPEGGAQLEVQDSGPGIAREHIPRLTERFYRVDGSRSRETGGTGLGLAIVKHVVQRHGGSIEIDSELGHGSTFRLVFPAARVRLRETAPAP